MGNADTPQLASRNLLKEIMDATEFFMLWSGTLDSLSRRDLPRSRTLYWLLDIFPHYDEHKEVFAINAVPSLEYCNEAGKVVAGVMRAVNERYGVSYSMKDLIVVLQKILETNKTEKCISKELSEANRRLGKVIDKEYWYIPEAIRLRCKEEVQQHMNLAVGETLKHYFLSNALEIQTVRTFLYELYINVKKKREELGELQPSLFPSGS